MSVVRHVALPGQQTYISGLSKIHNHHRMCLRPAVINYVFNPFTIARVLQPENAISMRYRGHNIRPAIGIYVAYVHKAKGVLEVPIRMERPVLLPRITWSLQPTFGSKDIVPAVPVYIADTNTVPIAVVADNMLHHSAVFISLVPGEGTTIVTKLRQNLVRLTVVIQINQEGELD